MQERRLAAIMFTDIVGYTALMGSDEAKAFKVLKINREIHEICIKRFEGTLIKEMGDGILASFSAASNAVQCAMEIQAETKAENIKLRIGIHEGEVVFEGSDVLGSGVNVASRLEAIAPEGNIYISEAVFRNIKNKSGIKTEFIDERTFKNVDEPVKVYKVLLENIKEKISNFPAKDSLKKTGSESQINPEVFITSGRESKIENQKSKLSYIILMGIIILIITALLIWHYLLKQSSPTLVEKDKSIAVLPFENDSPDKDNEYFCNGIMDEILAHLLKIKDLRVKSRTSVEKYRNPKKDIIEIGKELKVAFILEGSVRKAGNDLRITAQLIDAATGDHLWADTYDGKYTEEIFKFQGNVAKKVASSLQAMITPQEETRIERTPTTEMPAHDLCMKGGEMLGKWWTTGDNVYPKLALNLFNQALEIDPLYIDALSGKGTAFQYSGNYDSALFYYDRVIKLGDHDAYGAKGVLYMMFLYKPDSAFKYLNKAVELNPNNSGANLQLGQYYIEINYDLIKGLSYFNKAYEEGGESESWINWQISYLFWFIGDYPKAEKYLKKAFVLSQDCSIIDAYDGLLNSQGKYDEALHFLDSICNITACEQNCDMARFYVNLSQKEFKPAEEYLDKAIQKGYIHSNSYLSMDSLFIAYLYKETGNEKEAITILKSNIRINENFLKNNHNRVGICAIKFRLIAAYSILDEKEKALRYLSEIENSGFYWGIQDLMEKSPVFENIRDDPQFKAIIKRAWDKNEAIRAQVKEMEKRGEIDL